ncbi:site-2 protease family protein [Cupriavidus sp. D384]|uniref:site-2 protease family protein n=1 Tax=Cupriavidus sp. D384 TaxID=1538095 RepID=UPI000829712F|nr:site-2 protease family protein [Cupriavidus sp. D384]
MASVLPNPLNNPGQPSPEDLPLPPVRDDLRIFPGAAHTDGSPAWIIEDPVRNRHFRIGWLEFECLQRWHLVPAVAARQIRESTPLHALSGQILAFAAFLQANLLLRPAPGRSQDMAASHAPRAWLTWRWWLHHYLFFRIPLLRPTYRMRWVYAHLQWIFRPSTAWAVIALTLVGIALTLRQWDTFRHTLFESISLEGAVGFACALVVAKTLHELGHALVATHFGVRVGHMGVAFLVMWPMLYTDTSESWRLTQARQRLAIASAGIVTELIIAGLATLAWALLTPGPMRQACFYLATTSWVLSLALNASPFMRFDGYFILSDLLDLPNLHERAGALARTAMRRLLWGWNDPWPEPLPAPLRHKLIAFAWVTWCYRLVVFLGIALVVYHLFFKALGVFLFAVEIVFFIAMPIWRELKVWIRRRAETPRPRRGLLLAALLAVLVVLAVPWPTGVRAPALAHSARQWTAYSPVPAEMVTRTPAGTVKAGAPLIQLRQPELASESVAARASVAGNNARLTGLLDLRRGIEQQAATLEALQQSLARVRAVQAEEHRLLLVAPFDGAWVDVPDDVREGTWVGPKQVLGRLIDPSHWQVDAYVGEADIQYLRLGARACFYAETHPDRYCGVIRAISPSRSAHIPSPQLTTPHGGPIAAVEKQGVLLPEAALYLVQIELSDPLPSLTELRGRVYLAGESRSRLDDWLRNVLSVGIREAGF